ncbi:hypothetical protein F9Z44_13520 [Hydrogenophaga sp. PBL-H3]|nr:hypothetical protein F9Z45_13520 [Hydrogenophaga sp. PBL-H3]QHE81415.1 hypothetical protein F9Z44_13520 [Hydrogenophaga sp. PBL-H3]
MKFLHKLVLSMAAVLAITVIPTVGFSEDIDIYVGGTTGGAPNLLFVFDNSAAFEASAANTCKYLDDGTAPSLGNSVGGIQQCAFYNIVYGLKDDSVNLGLMIFNSNGMRDRYGEYCNANIGGCLAQPLTAVNASTKTDLLKWIRSWCTSGCSASGYNIKSNTARTGQAMQESWAYYAGQTGMSGRKYAGVAPGCQRNFVVFIGNATGANDKPGDGGNPPHISTLAAAPGITDALKKNIVIPETSYGTSTFSCGIYKAGTHNEGSGLYADEWARYMFQTDLYSGFDEKQGITSYTVGFMGPQCTPDYPALLTSTAKVGGGKYFPTTDYTQLKAAFDAILTEVQAVNSVFSSASLPVSVNAQGTFENQIFLGMFRPDGDGDPRWVGNLKQFQFILDYPDPTKPDPNKATLKLGDALGNEALSASGTGFISPSAVSFWTKLDAAPGFFVNDPKGAGGAFDYPDGEFVEKGGAAQVMRNKSLTSTNYSATASGPRKLYTYCPAIPGITAALCPASASSDLTASVNAFSAGNALITDSVLGVGLLAGDTVINWLAGQDNKALDEAGPGTPVTVRPSVHGDVIHSRPVVINYGDTRGTVVFYGANDGVYRAVNGSQTQAIGTTPPGGELWGLVAPEHFKKINRLRENDPDLKFSTAGAATSKPKDYFFDGSTGLYQTLKADGRTTNEAILYVTMRRGGRSMYAIDVADPVAPKVLWHISNENAAFGELGETWSRPRLALTNLPFSATGGSATLSRPVLVFGGGYSGGYDASGNPLGEDAEPPKANTMGRGIYVVNALTGARIWSAQKSCGTLSNCKEVSNMNWSFPADLSFVDRNNDGRVDRLYAADTGGNVWRVDINDADTTKWEVTKLAALGCDAGVCASGTTPRKFFFPPSVISVGATGAAGSFDAVLLGSGDREHPLQAVSDTSSSLFVRNRFYMLADTATGMSVATKAAAAPALPMTEAALDSLATASSRYTRDTSDGGFYFTFSTGEKVVNAPTTVRGTTYFGTNRPTAASSSSCSSNLGLARGYALDPFTGALSSLVYDGGGLPPSPTSGLVTITIPPTEPGKDPTSVTKLFCIGCAGGDPNKPSGDRTDDGPGSKGGGEGSDGADCRSAVGNCPPVKSVQKNPRRTYWFVR